VHAALTANWPAPDIKYVGDVFGLNVPLTVSLLTTVIAVLSVVVLPAFIVIVLNDVEPLIDCVVPENVMVAPLAVALYVPEFVQLPVSVMTCPGWVNVPLAPIVMFPDTVSGWLEVKVVTIDPAPIVSDLHAELLVRLG